MVTPESRKYGSEVDMLRRRAYTAWGLGPNSVLPGAGRRNLVGCFLRSNSGYVYVNADEAGAVGELRRSRMGGHTNRRVNQEVDMRG